MHAGRRWKIISYDIRDSKRYRRVFRILKGYGQSVQYSVFRAFLDDRSVEQLRWRLERELQPEDSLLVVDLCPTCSSRVRVRNRPNDWIAFPASFVVAGRHASPDADDRSAKKDQENPDS